LQTVRYLFNIYISIAVLPWRYVAEMGTATRYTLRQNTVSIMKGLVFK